MSEQEKSEDEQSKRVLERGSSITLINSYTEQTDEAEGRNQGSRVSKKIKYAALNVSGVYAITKPKVET